MSESVAFPEFALADLGGRIWTRADLSGVRTVAFCFASW
ncbi:MAG: hypothetical protein QOE86_279 [Solirubrobacteraceae bacterium]|nr:hypothetical protein [Solirubrobacteraceae bacterium]